MQMLAGLITESEYKAKLNKNINEIKVISPEPEDYYGELQAAENELEGAMHVTTEEEYLDYLLDASDEELEDFEGGYYDIAVVLSDLDDEEKQKAIMNIKYWAKNKLAQLK